MFVHGDYPEVQQHAITVLADAAIRAKDLDEEAALEAMSAAEKAMAHKTSKEEIAAAEASPVTATALLESIRRLCQHSCPDPPARIRAGQGVCPASRGAL